MTKTSNLPLAASMKPLISGGDSSEVRGQLREVVNITASYGAFAARRADGSIVTWGYESDGGRHNVEEQLKEVSWDLGWVELVLLVAFFL